MVLSRVQTRPCSCPPQPVCLPVPSSAEATDFARNTRPVDCLSSHEPFRLGLRAEECPRIRMRPLVAHLVCRYCRILSAKQLPFPVNEVGLPLCPGSQLPHAVTRKFPHLRGLTALRLPDGADARRLLRGQLAVSVASADGTALNATGARPLQEEPLTRCGVMLMTAYCVHLPTLMPCMRTQQTGPSLLDAGSIAIPHVDMVREELSTRPPTSVYDTWRTTMMCNPASNFDLQGSGSKPRVLRGLAHSSRAVVPMLAGMQSPDSKNLTPCALRLKLMQRRAAAARRFGRAVFA